MIAYKVSLLVIISVTEEALTQEYTDGPLTPITDLEPIDYLSNIAALDDAENRGPQWYDSDNNDRGDVSNSFSSGQLSILSMSDTISESKDVSSRETAETKELDQRYRLKRICTPCPHDMMKKYSNKGIQWICGGYQRARRSFKSECMMRFRNCQDGTMFVKYFDGLCKKSPHNGRNWFYIYGV